MYGLRYHYGKQQTLRRAAGDVPAPEEEDEVKYISKLITLADLQALGAITTGQIPFDDALPAGALPVALYLSKGDTAFTSSGGTVSNLTGSLIRSGGTLALVNGTVVALHAANSRGMRSSHFTNANNTNFPLDGWTPAVTFTVSGSGVNFANLLNGGDGITAVLLYAETVFPAPPLL